MSSIVKDFLQICKIKNPKYLYEYYSVCGLKIDINLQAVIAIVDTYIHTFNCGCDTWQEDDYCCLNNHKISQLRAVEVVY